ncbi:MAG: FAD-dependent oxidoreductase, partial [Eubacteriales bacterium]
DDLKTVETKKVIYNPKAVIIATGAVPKMLPIPSEAQFYGKGIHYCATCDGAMYEDSVVGVAGGGNSALEEALFLTNFASKVIMLRRYDYFNGAAASIEAVLKHPKIEVMFNWDIVDVAGEDFVTSALLRNTKTGEEKSVELSAVFGYIGTEPKTELFKADLTLNKQGYILTDENLQTNIKGVFAAGDIREKTVRQITTAVADGTIAALNAEKVIKQR